MHISAVLFAGLFAVASANSSTVTTVSSTTTATATYSLTPAQSSQAGCLKACASGDVTCEAKCVDVPSPDAAAANKTNHCVASCPQGNGTAADNSAYANCLTNCIDTNYYTATGTAASATGDSGNNKVASSGAAGSTGSSSGSSGSSSSSNGNTSSSASGSSSSAGSAANMVRVGGSAISLLGFLAFFLAL